MKRLFLLDAYALIYRAYYAFLRIPRINSKGMNTSAIYGFVNTLQDLLKRENPTHLAVVFDPSGPTFRHEAYKEYKANREETPEDIRISVPIIKDIVRAYRIPVIEVPGYEADDVIGSLSKIAEQRDFDVFMMTPDKDYGQLVSEHVFIYKPRFGESGFDIIGKDEVLKKWGISDVSQVIDLLGLMGDASDNIPGCPGIGEKTAAKLLSTFNTIEELLDRTSELKGSLKSKVENNREQIVFSKYLATIKTDVPIEFEENEFLCSKPDEESLVNIFRELEFFSLLKKINSNESEDKIVKSNVKKEVTEQTLFQDFNTETQISNIQVALNNISNVAHDYKCVNDKEGISALIDTLNSVDHFCFDTETTNVDALHAELVGMSFAIKEHEAYYVPVSPIREEAYTLLTKFKGLFENEHISKTGHNLKYDITVLGNYGISVNGILFDTMIAHYLLQPEMRHGMDYLSEVLLGYEPIHIEEIIGNKGKKQLCMRDVEMSKITEYAAEDADITLQLRHVIEPMLEKESLNNLFYNIEMPLMKVLCKMERTGVVIDDFTLAQTSQTMRNELINIEQKIKHQAQTDINISSPKQIGELLFDKLKITDKAKKTKTGQYVTDEETLETLRDKHPIISDILEYRGIKKLLSTYIDALPKLIDPISGRVHTSFNQTVTATGRLSSSNPNLQNIPIREEQGKGIRKAFVASEGCVFMSADYSQIELRLMAHLSGDENMIRAFKSDYDIHAATAANIYKIPIEDVTPDMRRKAKTANFGIIYGISVFGLAERLNIPRSEAKEIIDGYFDSFPRVKEYMDECIISARNKGYVETLLGRRRYLPDINSRNANVRGFAERNAINAPIQGTAADLIKIAMIKIDDRMQQAKLSSEMILQVHDELNFNVPENEVETLKSIIKEEMEGALKLEVPLKVDIGIGKNWLEAH